MRRLPAEKNQVLVAAAVAVALAAGALGYWFFLRARSDEDRVKEVLAAIEAAAEERDVGGVLVHISERYKGEGWDGRLSMDRNQLKGILFGYFLAQKKKGVAVSVQDLVVKVLPGNKVAKATFRAKFGDTEAEAALGGDEVSFIVDFEREPDDVWRVTSHRRGTRDEQP